jgi:hypothetical protein
MKTIVTKTGTFSQSTCDRYKRTHETETKDIIFREKHSCDSALHDLSIEKDDIVIVPFVHVSHEPKVWGNELTIPFPCHVFRPKTVEPIFIMDSKARFARFCVDNGLGEGRPDVYATVIDGRLNRSCKDIVFPCVMKLNGQGGYGIEIIGDENDWEEKREGWGYYSLEEYVQHEKELSCHCAVKNGKIIIGIVMETCVPGDAPYFIKRGPNRTYKHVPLLDEHKKWFENFFTKIDYTGVACVDYTYIGDKLYVFEINPRFGASLIYDPSFLDVLNAIKGLYK